MSAGRGHRRGRRADEAPRRFLWCWRRGRGKEATCAGRDGRLWCDCGAAFAGQGLVGRCSARGQHDQREPEGVVIVVCVACSTVLKGSVLVRNWAMPYAEAKRGKSAKGCCGALFHQAAPALHGSARSSRDASGGQPEPARGARRDRGTRSPKPNTNVRQGQLRVQRFQHCKASLTSSAGTSVTGQHERVCHALRLQIFRVMLEWSP